MIALVYFQEGTFGLRSCKSKASFNCTSVNDESKMRRKNKTTEPPSSLMARRLRRRRKWREWHSFPCMFYQEEKKGKQCFLLFFFTRTEWYFWGPFLCSVWRQRVTTFVNFFAPSENNALYVDTSFRHRQYSFSSSKRYQDYQPCTKSKRYQDLQL